MTDFCSENIYIDMTPRVGRREWDSNPAKRTFAGLYWNMLKD